MRHLFCAVLFTCGFAAAEQCRESFDRDPGWDGHQNRATYMETRKVVQDFGYSATRHASAANGEIGGMISPDGHPAYYAKALPETTFNDPFSASGTVVIEPGGTNMLLGFFNHATVNEWRTPNSVVFRINARGDVAHVHIEYATSKWRASAGVIGRYDREADRMHPIEIPCKGVHTWSLEYDPKANNGSGAITAKFDAHTAVCAIDAGHRADGARFDRFGLLNVVKSADGGSNIWIGDLRLNGAPQALDADPMWEGVRNRATFESAEVRPRFDFGYCATAFAGGKAGEIGGLFFRGDCREPGKLAYYGARVESLTLGKPLHASGKIAMRRGVSDSTTLFGFFHSKESVRVNPSQKSGLPADFLGVAVEGPSSEGFYVYPTYRCQGAEQNYNYGKPPLRIYPDGASRLWTLDYDPAAGGGKGIMVVTLDGQRVELPLGDGHRAEGAQFDRFGFVTPWIDGNGQRVYLDDLEFTCKQ